MPKSREVSFSTSGSDSDGEIETKAKRKKPREAGQETKQWREFQARRLIQEHRGKRCISLSPEQWIQLKDQISETDDAIKLI
uniref:Uncharacterized protein n=1 Tax=Amphiprion ocellaris TaxID=80972 RepID=A0A3Q1B1A7_AMPOC